MAVTVTRDQVIRLLRDHEWKYDRKGRHVEIWKQRGSVKRVSLAMRDVWPEELVKITLAQAGFTREQYEAFMRGATKEPAKRLC